MTEIAANLGCATDEVGLPRSWSKQQVCDSLHINRRTIDGLIGGGRVGYYVAGRSQRFLAQHVQQIISALEVPARAPSRLPDGPLDRTDPEYYRRLGMTDRAAVVRARKVLRHRISNGGL